MPLRAVTVTPFAPPADVLSLIDAVRVIGAHEVADAKTSATNATTSAIGATLAS